MVDLNFEAIFLLSAISMTFGTSYQLLIIPKSNGLAEAGVKSVKNILKKCVSSGADADFMLYEWQNVPCADGYSPSQLMFGRSQRTCLPSLSLQNPPIDFVKAAASKDSAHSRSKIDHDRSKLSLSPLLPGQHVYLQSSRL